MSIEDQLKLLRHLNATVNGGRGASVLRSAIYSLERGNVEEARSTLLTDRDKLWQYEIIDKLVDAELLPI
jgi:hypothetical protein